MSEIFFPSSSENAGSPGTVHVDAGDRELVYSLTLPELSEVRWNPPPQVRRGLKGVRRPVAFSSALWPWLASLGALGLLAEWILFGRFRRSASMEPSFWKIPLRLRAKARPSAR